MNTTEPLLRTDSRKLKIVHVYIDNMKIDQNDLQKDVFADRWGLPSLVKLGHDVTLICGGSSKKRKEYTWKGVKVIELPSLFEFTTTSRVLKGLYSELSRVDADVFHTHHYCSLVPEITGLVGWKRKIPVFFNISK